MDLIALLKELTSTGISDFVFVGVTLVVVRYWFSETRREISKEIDDKVGSLKTDLEQLIKENRQEIAAVRTETRQEFDAARAYSEQAHKETRQEIHALRTETRQEIHAHRTETRQDFEAVRTNSQQAHTETRQEIHADRAYAEQSHKEIMQHLIDVRERLANIEGRLGLPTPRISGVSPPLEAPAEEPSAQS